MCASPRIVPHMYHDLDGVLMWRLTTRSVCPAVPIVFEISSAGYPDSRKPHICVSAIWAAERACASLCYD